MAILKKTEKKEETKDVQTATQSPTPVVPASLHNVLKKPRVTEKAAILSGSGVYTFEIDPKATKIDVARAIKQVYKVDPVRVAISTLPPKKKFFKGKRGVKPGVKKAIVYLKKGDTIDFV